MIPDFLDGAVAWLPNAKADKRAIVASVSLNALAESGLSLSRINQKKASHNHGICRLAEAQGTYNQPQ